MKKPHKIVVVVSGDLSFGTIATNIRFLPILLTELNIFPSSSQLRKNRGDLWRDIEDGEVIKIGRRRLRLYLFDHFIEIDDSILPL